MIFNIYLDKSPADEAYIIIKWPRPLAQRGREKKTLVEKLNNAVRGSLAFSVL